MIALPLVCLALNVYFEARNDDVAGQVAVAQIVMERVKNSEYPETICLVVTEGGERRHACQFSWHCDGKSDTPYDEHAWERALLVASAVMAGSGHVALRDATHYHAWYAHPDWVDLPNMEFIGVFGLHYYYMES